MSTGELLATAYEGSHNHEPPAAGTWRRPSPQKQAQRAGAGTGLAAAATAVAAPSGLALQQWAMAAARMIQEQQAAAAEQQRAAGEQEQVQEQRREPLPAALVPALAEAEPAALAPTRAEAELTAGQKLPAPRSQQAGQEEDGAEQQLQLQRAASGMGARPLATAESPEQLVLGPALQCALGRLQVAGLPARE